MPLDRRRLLGGLGLSLAAPAIIRIAGLIMPVPRRKTLLSFRFHVVSRLDAERLARAKRDRILAIDAVLQAYWDPQRRLPTMLYFTLEQPPRVETSHPGESL